MKKSKMILKSILFCMAMLAFSFSYAQTSNCPKAGKPDCPLVKDCPKKGTADCPLVKSCCKKATADAAVAPEEATAQADIANCPLKGTPDCPLIKNCPKKGTADCPYTKGGEQTAEAKKEDNAAPACCRKKEVK